MNKEQYILVVGGSGFIGHSLCSQLINSNQKTINFSKDENDIEGCINITGDVCDPGQLKPVFKKYPIQCVVNLASLLVSASTKNPLQAARVGVIGSLNIFELCKDFNIRRLIFGSSTVFLKHERDPKKAVKESGQVFISSAYGEIKYFIENIGLRIGEGIGTEFIIARIPLVFGPGEPSISSAYRTDIFNLLLSGGDIFFPFQEDEVLPISHFKDVAAAFVLLVKANTLKDQIYHLPNESIKVSRLAQLAQDIGHDIRVTFGERRLTDGAPFVDWGRIEKELGAVIMPIDQRLLEHKEFLLQKEI
jgi:nucleoside-diphosphate-sugar epimerase